GVIRMTVAGPLTLTCSMGHASGQVARDRRSSPQPGCFLADATTGADLAPTKKPPTSAKLPLSPAGKHLAPANFPLARASPAGAPGKKHPAPAKMPLASAKLPPAPTPRTSRAYLD